MIQAVDNMNWGKGRTISPNLAGIGQFSILFREFFLFFDVRSVFFHDGDEPLITLGPILQHGTKLLYEDEK